MSVPRTPIAYLHDIIDAMELAAQFIRGMDEQTFAQDTKTVFAVVRALEVVGEATKQIPAAIRNRAPGVPWSNMARMRDLLIHHYVLVRTDLVWKTVTEAIPIHKPLIAALIADLHTTP